jgi:hypothetical protein
VSFDYGSRNYGQGLYGGREEFLGPDGIGASLVVYKPDGAIRSIFQTGVGNLLKIDFDHGERGCGSFSAVFSGYANIHKNDKVKIYIMDSDDCFFTGVVRDVPIDGSTKQSWEYKGYGLNDYLERVNTLDVSYAATSVEAVVRVLAASIAAQTPINYNSAKVATFGVSITGVNFHYETMKKALENLTKIANSDGSTYIFGVDRDGDFFFAPRSDELRATLVVGKKGRYGIEKYEPEDKAEYRSALLVLDKDGVFQFKVSSSDPDLDIYEEKVTAPDIDAADIAAWAAGVLAQKNADTRQSQVDWKVWPYNPLCLVADGVIRVISNVISPDPGAVSGTAYGALAYGAGYYGGGPSYVGRDLDDTLEVRQVAYSIGPNGASRSIQLGSLPATLARKIAKLVNHVDDMESSLGI